VGKTKGVYCFGCLHLYIKININYKLIIMQLSAVQLFIYPLAHAVLAVAYPGILFGEGRWFSKFS